MVNRVVCVYSKFKEVFLKYSIRKLGKKRETLADVTFSVRIHSNSSKAALRGLPWFNTCWWAVKKRFTSCDQSWCTSWPSPNFWSPPVPCGLLHRSRKHGRWGTSESRAAPPPRPHQLCTVCGPLDETPILNGACLDFRVSWKLLNIYKRIEYPLTSLNIYV